MKGIALTRKTLALGAAAVTLAGASLLTSATSAAASMPEIENYANGSCLDAEGTTAGSRVSTYRCWGGENQSWYQSQDRHGRPTIRNSASDLCLDIQGASTANGAPLILWHCNDAWNQVWSAQTPDLPGWGGGCVHYVNPTTGRAIDNPDPTSYGKQVAAYDVWGGANQVWC